MAKAKKQKQIKITLVRGLARTLPKQRRTVKALGIWRISQLSGMMQTRLSWEW